VVRLDFALARGRGVQGRVIDESDRPVAGAYVAAVASEFGDDGQRTDWISARTGADGRYRLDGLTRELGHALFVACHGYGTQVHDFPEEEFVIDDLVLADVVLHRPALLAGRVELAGAPPADVEVELRGWNHDRYRFATRATQHGRFYVDTRSMRTDGRGRFWFADLAAGRYQLVARVPGRPESAPLELELVTGERREDVVLHLEAGGTLHGVVQDERGGPLAGVYVSARAERLADPAAPAPGHVHAVTRADGGFEIAGLPDGEYALHAYPLETPPASPDEPWLPASVEHVATGAQPVVIELARGASIRGRVLDAAGAPLAGHALAATSGTAEEYTHTDAEGRFALTVPKGSRWTLEVRGPPQGAAFEEVLLRRADVAPGEVELRLERVSR
jgi:protocatechuate 3,4-dioxygenase beta subunit